MTTPTYAAEPATTFIGALAEDTCRYVFVRSDTPVSPTAANGLASTIRLVVSATTTGSSGATLEVETAAVDNPAVVDVVFAETGTANGNVVENGVSMAFDQYFVGTLTVTKTAAVISDGFSAAGQYKAIPGAVVEYTITRAEQRPRDQRCVADGAHSGQHDLRRRLDHAERRGACGRGGRNALRRWRIDQLPGSRRGCHQSGFDCR